MKEQKQNHIEEWMQDVHAALPPPPPPPPPPVPERPRRLQDLEPIRPDPNHPPYSPFTARGRIRFLTICSALSLPSDTPFSGVQQFLADNPSIIRSVALRCVPHPDRLFYEHSTLSEVHFSGQQALRYNRLLWQAISEIRWQDREVYTILEMIISTKRMAEFSVRKGLCKVRRFTTPRDFHFRLLAEERDYEERCLAEFEDIKQKRQQRPGSLLKHDITPVDDDE